MNLDKFSYINQLHTKKYVVNGYIEDMSCDKIVFLLTKSDKKKYFLKFDLDPVRIYPLIETSDFNLEDIPDFAPGIFYKPLGYLEASFFIVRKFPEVLRSNMFTLTNNPSGLEFKFIDKERFFKIDEFSFKKHLEDKVFVPDEVIVHDGKMHADDILCVSLLKIVNPNILVSRTRDIPSDFNGLVCDVGGGRYDHHDLDKLRFDDNGNQLILPDGKPEVYSAFGLLARDILPGLIGQKSYQLVDSQIIRSIDKCDNYGYPSDLAYYFDTFNPTWNSDMTYDEAFLDAVDYGVNFLQRILSRELARQEAIPYLQSKIAKATDDILVLDYRVPWQALTKKSNILFTIYPTDDGKFALQTVPLPNTSADEKINKIDMPQTWLEEKPLGCTFVHKSLFFAIFDTKENAFTAAKQAIFYGKDNRIIN